MYVGDDAVGDAFVGGVLRGVGEGGLERDVGVIGGVFRCALVEGGKGADDFGASDVGVDGVEHLPRCAKSNRSA